MRALVTVLGIALAIAGCDAGGGREVDASSADARVAADTSSSFDARPTDASVTDASASGDASTSTTDASTTDASTTDASTTTTDASTTTTDASTTTTDASTSPDAGHDASVVPGDAGHDASSGGGCVSGAVGTRALRFRWRGSSPGSTAYVDYELNQLPDTTRWHVSAASMSFSYTPVFDDTFLGEGGLDLEGTAFIDVQLSTVGLSSLSSVTIAIYGRSFDTTASGSFHWQTFHGTGSAPTNLVANSAPYEWYLADATSEIVAGDSGALLRIYPGPSSDALIVDRVEICFAE